MTECSKIETLLIATMMALFNHWSAGRDPNAPCGREPRSTSSPTRLLAIGMVSSTPFECNGCPGTHAMASSSSGTPFDAQMERIRIT
jgi:hypothetical protein